MKCFFLCFFTIFSLPLGAAIKVGEDGLIRSEVSLQNCRAYGVNYFDVFHRVLENSHFNDYKIGFSELSSFSIPFIRFSAMGHWPKESLLYFKNKKEYFRRLDLIFSEAEKNKVGLIPSLFFNLSTVPDLMKESTNAWSNPNSKTTLFMKEYVREFFLRYSNSRALWGVEFSNETNLYTDLPNASKFRPKMNVKRGTPASRTSEDSLKFNDLQFALTLFAKEVRKYDVNIPISSGHGLPRRYSYNNMVHNRWDLDVISQTEYMLRSGVPEEIDLLSVHLYPDHRKKLGHFGENGVVSYDKILGYVQKVALEENKAVFVGEFGVSTIDKSLEEEKQEFDILMASIYNSGVSLAALWVYRFNYQSKSFDVRQGKVRGYQLYKIMSFNKKLEADGELCKF